jgi:hypothetical protein
LNWQAVSAFFAANLSIFHLQKTNGVLSIRFNYPEHVAPLSSLPEDFFT